MAGGNAHSAIDNIIGLQELMNFLVEKGVLIDEVKEDREIQQKTSENLKRAYDRLQFEKKYGKYQVRDDKYDKELWYGVGTPLEMAKRNYDKALWYGEHAGKRGYELSDVGYILKKLGMLKPESVPEYEGKGLNDLLQNYESMR